MLLFSGFMLINPPLEKDDKMYKMIRIGDDEG